jgi:hypothetical protein
MWKQRLEKLSNVSFYLMIVLSMMMSGHGNIPTMRETIYLVLVMGIIVQLLPLRSVSPNRRALVKNRLRAAGIAVLFGVAYYVLPRLGNFSVLSAYRFWITVGFWITAVIAFFGIGWELVPRLLLRTRR